MKLNPNHKIKLLIIRITVGEMLMGFIIYSLLSLIMSFILKGWIELKLPRYLDYGVGLFIGLIFVTCEIVLYLDSKRSIFLIDIEKDYIRFYSGYYDLKYHYRDITSIISKEEGPLPQDIPIKYFYFQISIKEKKQKNKILIYPYTKKEVLRILSSIQNGNPSLDIYINEIRRYILSKRNLFWQIESCIWDVLKINVSLGKLK